MIRANSSWKSKIQYPKILEYFRRSIKKKRICQTEKFKLFKVCSFMHSILGRSSFSTNSSISEVWHGSDQLVALLRHYWAFCSSVLLDRLFLIFLLKHIPSILYGVQVRHVGWPIKHSNILVIYNILYILKCFNLHIMNLKYLKIALFEISNNCHFFSRHSYFFWCTCKSLLC